jgi:hypothetical protein|tara:strand:+ start:189 stop:1778 length:1590 start_codon:yes stop_codon:yes gene_type:complete
MKKYLIILIILFSNISQAESCNNNKLSQFLKPMITGDNRILPKQIKYLSGKKLKEFLYNNEITISYYNNKHSYFFYPNFTYDVFSYPYKSRKLIGKGKWELYEGYGIGPGYNRTGKGCDYLYLDGFRSDIRDANFVFLLNKIEIKVVGNIQNPSDYILLKILSITDRKKVDKIISKIKREEDIEKNRLAKLTDLKEKKINALNKIITNNNTNYKKLTEIISIKTEMGKSTDELNSILNDYEKKISDIKTEIVNFDNLKNLENYQILSDFIDPLNNILNQPENNLDKLKSEYELFKIEEEKRLAEEERKRIEEEQRIAAAKEKKHLSEYSNTIDGFQDLKFGMSYDNLIGGNCNFNNSEYETTFFLTAMEFSPAGLAILSTMNANKILLSGNNCNKVLGGYPTHLLGFDKLDRLTSVVLFNVKKFNFLNENAQDRFDQIIDQLDDKYTYWLPNNFSEKQIDLWRNDYNNDSKPALVFAFANGEVASIVTKDAQTSEHILSVGYYSPNSKFKENFINVLRQYTAESTGSGL